MKSLTNIFICSVVSIVSLSVLQAREVELGSLESRFLPYAKVDNNPAAEIQPEYTRVRIVFPSAGFGEKQGLLASSLSYENLHFNYRNGGAIPDSTRVDTLHGVQLALFYTRPLQRPNWSIRTFLTSGLSSDFASVTWAALRVQGGFIFERAKNNEHVGLGLVAVDNYGRTLPFPAFFYENSIGRNRFSVRAPTQVSWFYVPNEKWQAGLALRVNGGSYRLEEPGIFKGKTARYSIGTFGPSAFFKISPLVSLTLDAGTVFRHKFGIYDDRKEFRDYDLRRSYFVSAGFGFRLGRK